MSVEYISAKEAAVEWGISQRRVAVLCSESRIAGATVIGNMWLIPRQATKPVDARSNPQVKLENLPSGTVRPFLKWAGGKSQLLEEIRKFYPFENSQITKYAEPFIGGGAVLFDILSRYALREIYISDTNAELINAYCVIRDDIDNLVSLLAKYQFEYVPLEMEERSKYYAIKRERFNELKIGRDVNGNTNLEKAALTIFLNHTCFNGLYRVNRKGLFNVPMGKYKNPLIGSKNIESDFDSILAKYPEVLKCIPLLLAVRSEEIYAIDEDGEFTYNFADLNLSAEQYKTFMRKTGLFNLMQNHIINNLYDYATGVETGLDSNGRKNRGGHLMENLVENYIKKAGYIKNESCFKGMTISEITAKWGIDLSTISNNGKGWVSARHNLEETFDVMDNIYNVHDMENGIIGEIFK